jgi:hypothetical protein
MPRRGAMAAAPTITAADNNSTVKSLATRALLGGGKTENTDKFLRLAGSHQYKSTFLVSLICVPLIFFAHFLPLFLRPCLLTSDLFLLLNLYF